MRPEWKDAPEWANWLSMDRDGSWWWSQLEPHHDNEGFSCSLPGKYSFAGDSNLEPTKEQRPK